MAKNPNAKPLSHEEIEDADFKRWEREEQRRQAELGHREDINQTIDKEKVVMS